MANLGLAVSAHAAPTTSAYCGTDAVAWTGSADVVAAVGTDGSLNYWWQPQYGTGWNWQQVAPPGSVACNSPQIVWTGSYVVIGAGGADGILNTWWQAGGATGWTKKPVSGSVAIDRTEFGLTWSGGAVVAAVWAYDGIAENLYSWRNSPGTSTWTQQDLYSYRPPSVINGVVPDAAISSTATGTVIAATDTMGNLLYWWQLNGSTTWHQQTVAATPGTMGYIEPAITSTGTAVVITAADSSNGNLDYWWQANGGTTWNKQLVAASPFADGGYFSPRIVWNGSGVLISADFNSLHESNTLNFWWQAADTTPWHPEQIASSTNGYSDAGIAWASNAVHVVSVNLDNGSVDFWWEWANSPTWNPETIS